MKLVISSTSPFARIVRILLRERGISITELVVNPWDSPDELRQVSPACQVPVLLLDDGLPINGSLFIAQYIEQLFSPSVRSVAITDLRVTALAFSMMEAFASIIIGRRSLPDFDESPVGLRRRQAIIEGLQRLELMVPRGPQGHIKLSVIVLVCLLDAIRFRFANASWIPQIPQLDELAAEMNDRPSFQATLPY